MPHVQPNKFFQKLLELFPKMAPYVSTDVQRAEWVQALLPFDHDFAIEALHQYYRRHTVRPPSLETLISFFEAYCDEKRRAARREQKERSIREILEEGGARAADHSSPQDARVMRYNLMLFEMGLCHPRRGVRIAQQWGAWIDDHPEDLEWVQYCREQAESWTQEAITWYQKNGSAGSAAKHVPALLTASSGTLQ